MPEHHRPSHPPILGGITHPPSRTAHHGLLGTRRRRNRRKEPATRHETHSLRHCFSTFGYVGLRPEPRTKGCPGRRVPPSRHGASSPSRATLGSLTRKGEAVAADTRKRSLPLRGACRHWSRINHSIISSKLQAPSSKTTRQRLLCSRRAVLLLGSLHSRYKSRRRRSEGAKLYNKRQERTPIEEEREEFYTSGANVKNNYKSYTPYQGPPNKVERHSVLKHSVLRYPDSLAPVILDLS